MFVYFFYSLTMPFGWKCHFQRVLTIFRNASVFLNEFRKRRFFFSFLMITTIIGFIAVLTAFKYKRNRLKYNKTA